MVDTRPPTAPALVRMLRPLFATAKSSVAASVLILLILVAAVGPFVAPQDPYDLAASALVDAKMPPGSRGSEGFVFWAGSDAHGRDCLSSMIYGLRISLAVGVGSGFIALVLGVATGLAAAFFGGFLEAVTMRIVDLILGLPAIFVALMLLAVLGRGVPQVLLALVIAQFAVFARLALSATLVEKHAEYVMAALALGSSSWRILVVHLLPNIIPPIIVVGTLQVANAIAIEATLSFLGIGLPITQPSLGLLIADGYEVMLYGQYWISFFPGLLLLALVLSINLVGDRLRDALNPRLR